MYSPYLESPSSSFTQSERCSKWSQLPSTLLDIIGSLILTSDRFLAIERTCKGWYHMSSTGSGWSNNIDVINLLNGLACGITANLENNENVDFNLIQQMMNKRMGKRLLQHRNVTSLSLPAWYCHALLDTGYSRCINSNHMMVWPRVTKVSLDDKYSHFINRLKLEGDDQKSSFHKDLFPLLSSLCFLGLTPSISLQQWKLIIEKVGPKLTSLDDHDYSVDDILFISRYCRSLTSLSIKTFNSLEALDDAVKAIGSLHLTLKHLTLNLRANADWVPFGFINPFLSLYSLRNLQTLNLINFRYDDPPQMAAISKLIIHLHDSKSAVDSSSSTTTDTCRNNDDYGSLVSINGCDINEWLRSPPFITFTHNPGNTVRLLTMK